MRHLTTSILIAIGLAAAAAPAVAQSVIRPGDVLGGELTARDWRLSDNSHYDCFQLDASEGEVVSITMESDAFDAYLAVVEGSACDASALATDDDSAGGTDARLELTMGAGRYLIRANSLSSDKTGAYTLSMTSRRQAAANETVFMMSGRSMYQVGSLSAEDRVATDDSYFDCFAFDAPEGATIDVGVGSEYFDAYATLYKGGTCSASDQIDSNDDGFDDDGTDARITRQGVSAGRYSVAAGSLNAKQTGDYEIAISVK